MDDQKKMSITLTENIAEVIGDAVTDGAEVTAIWQALLVNVGETLSDVDPQMREKVMQHFIKMIPEVCAKFVEGGALAENRRVQ